MSLIERITPLIISLTLCLIFPISLFYPASPNVILSLCAISCFLYVLHKGDWPPINNVLQNFWPLGLFVLWALIASTWSISPVKSLENAGKIFFAVCLGGSVFAYMRMKDTPNIMDWFRVGYIAAIAILILDEILDTAILRSLRGPQAGTNYYYHGLALLILGFWPLLNTLKSQHPSRPMLLYVALFTGLFYMTDHAAIFAILASILVFLVTYTAPKFFIRLSAIVSTIVILGFPFVTRNMDAVSIIEKAGSALMKASYHHRLFILQRTTQMIFEKPWTGHGVNAYRDTVDLTRNLEEETSKLHQLGSKPQLDADALGQALHPHNFSLQVWYELGAIGAILFSFFIASFLWRISSIPGKRFEQASFMGLYSSIFIIAHITLGAWQTWWLLSLAVMMGIMLYHLKKPSES